MCGLLNMFYAREAKLESNNCNALVPHVVQAIKINAHAYKIQILQCKLHVKFQSQAKHVL